MKISKTSIPALILSLALINRPASAQSLEIGSPAPEMAVSHWVKGNPVDLAAAKGKQIIVVEFWATWCRPCIDSIPHLTELQHKYADKKVSIVAITEKDPGNTLTMVEKLVADSGNRLDYTVGFDETGRVYASYMTAAGQDVIPTAFAIDKASRIAWIGHPGDLDDVLSEMVAGKYDLELARKIARIDTRIDQFAMSGDWTGMLGAIDKKIALKPKSTEPWLSKWQVQANYLADRDGATKSIQRAFELAAYDADETAEIALQVLSESDRQGYSGIVVAALEKAQSKSPKNRDVATALFQAMFAAGRRDDAAARAPKIIELLKGDALRLNHFAGILSSPQHAAACGDLAITAIDLAVQSEPAEPQHYLSKFYILNAFKKDAATSESLGRKLVQVANGDAEFLNAFSWGLLNDEIYKGKYDKLALLAAELMHESDGGDGWSQLETLALAKFTNGAVAEAVVLQKQAITKCDLDLARASLIYSLDRFEEAVK